MGGGGSVAWEMINKESVYDLEDHLGENYLFDIVITLVILHHKISMK